jgi:tetratricopeptide (TPR) repeat protein
VSSANWLSAQPPEPPLVEQLQKAYVSDFRHPDLKGTNVAELRRKLTESIDATKDREKRSKMLFALAMVENYENSGISKQQQYLSRALEDAKAVAYQRGEAAITGKLAMVHECVGEIESARKEIQLVLEIHKKLNMRGEVATDLCNLGMLEGNNRNTKEAIQKLEEALRISKETRSDFVVAFALCNLSAAYVDNKDEKKAKLVYDELQQYRRFAIPFFLYYREQKFSTQMPPLPPFLAAVSGVASMKAVTGQRQYYNFNLSSYRVDRKDPIIPCGYVEAAYSLP